jgi:hypothetical protein
MGALWRKKAVKQGTMHAAWAALALVASAVTPAGAEPLRLAQVYGPEVLPPYEVVTVLRSAGLDPLSRPFLRGPNYVVRAVDRDDREVRVVVDARHGDIVQVVPVAIASRMPQTGRGLTIGPYERMDGYEPPPAHYGAEPPVGYEDDPMDAAAPRPPAAVPGVPSVRTLPPPVMRQAPVRGAELQSLPEPRVITADPGHAGVLPPPPERFRQHTVLPAKPKPVKRNVASIPKQAPLPKPRPQVHSQPEPSTASNVRAAAPASADSASAAPPSTSPAAEKTPSPPEAGSAAAAPAPTGAAAPALPDHPADELPN